MRVFHITGAKLTESAELPTALPEQGFVWLACTRREYEARLSEVQLTLQQLVGTPLVDLHVSDLLNRQLPSHYDYTSQYDVLVFRRLATQAAQQAAAASLAPSSSAASAALPTTAATASPGTPASPVEVAAENAAAGTGRRRASGPPVLRRIDTSPVGFAVFDRLLLTVHPQDCTVRDVYAQRLLNAASAESRAAGVKLPASPADLMLRVVNLMVDGYLELRRELTRQMDHWQSELLRPKARFSNWNAVLDARLALHELDEICEDQRSAVQDWIDSLETWPEGDTPGQQRERELLKVRSRDVLEHIERVVHHVRRLEHSAETAVQMHFSAQRNRTNDIMRTLTAVTAVFLPLNLITGFFGMNFEFMPLIHTSAGFWVTLGLMLLLVTVVVTVFWRKQYLERRTRR